MKYRRFGRTGWEVSEIGFGAWAIGEYQWGKQDDRESITALHRALDLGMNFIDTAQAYGNGHSERIVARVLNERWEQRPIYVATKVPPKNLVWPSTDEMGINEVFPSDYIIERCEFSLRNLQVDCLDLYQLHTWTRAFNETDEWFEAMSRLKEQGKIRAIGISVSNAQPEDVIGTIERGRIDAIQVVYNIFEQLPAERLLPLCQEQDVAVIARVPFDEGSLTGKFTKETTFPEGDFRKFYFRGRNLEVVVDRVEEVRAFKNLRHPEMSMPEYALRYCLSHRAVSTVIPGIRSVAQAEMNSAPSDGQLLDEEELAEMKRFAWHRDLWHEEV